MQFVSRRGQKFENQSKTSDDIFYDEMNLFEVGDKVKSASFGIGEIVDIDGMAVSIRFSDGKIKKLNAEYANLQKV